MDPSLSSAMSDFNAQDNKDMQSFLQQEQQKARFQENIHTLTATCWPKCVTRIAGAELEKGEQSCLQNCVNRFIDAQKVVIQNLEGKMR